MEIIQNKITACAEFLKKSVAIRAIIIVNPYFSGEDACIARYKPGDYTNEETYVKKIGEEISKKELLKHLSEKNSHAIKIEKEDKPARIFKIPDTPIQTMIDKKETLLFLKIFEIPNKRKGQAKDLDTKNVPGADRNVHQHTSSDEISHSHQFYFGLFTDGKELDNAKVFENMEKVIKKLIPIMFVELPQIKI